MTSPTSRVSGLGVSRRGILVGCVVVAMAFAACTTATQQRRGGLAELKPDAYPGELRAPSAMPGNFVLRQYVTAHWRERGEKKKRGFDAVVEKRGDTLKLIGLSPMGQVGFVLTQTGSEVTFDNKMGRPMPFPPKFILLDMQRALFPWLSDGKAPLGDGRHEQVIDGERVVEVWEDGRFETRTFERLDAQPAGVMTVTAESWPKADGARVYVPKRVELDNRWFGYRLVVKTFEQGPMPIPAP